VVLMMMVVVIAVFTLSSRMAATADEQKVK
jgi:hypothetical protein